MAVKLRKLLGLAAGWQNVQHNTLARRSEKKNFAMKLNSRTQSAQNPHNNSPVVLVHGLFGSLDNLGILARDLVNDYDILQVDMRNHGLSPRSPEMTYAAMAQDLLDTLDAHWRRSASLAWSPLILPRWTTTCAVMMKFSTPSMPSPTPASRPVSRRPR